MVSFHRSANVATEPDAAVAETAPPALPVSSAAFPRVNLMPEVVAQEARVHHAKMALVGASIVSVLAVAGLYVMAFGSVNEAQDELDSATAQSAVLNAESAKYADVPKVQAQVAYAHTQAYNALGGEVRWSFLLNNLSLTMPAGTSLQSFVATVSEFPPSSAAAQKPASGQTSFTGVLGHPGIGTITYTGEAFGYPQVASFLDSQAKQASLLDGYVNSVTANSESAGSGGTTNAAASKGVQFKSVATISDKALSHRYDEKAGE
jgi:Tfp pilus assembly protein PilN